jgi:hypothetical protein
VCSCLLNSHLHIFLCPVVFVTYSPSYKKNNFFNDLCGTCEKKAGYYKHVHTVNSELNNNIHISKTVLQILIGTPYLCVILIFTYLILLTFLPSCVRNVYPRYLWPVISVDCRTCIRCTNSASLGSPQTACTFNRNIAFNFNYYRTSL